MDITTIEYGAVTVLGLKGSLDATTAEQADEQIAAEFNNERHKLVVDMSEIEFLSSAGLRTLLGAVQIARPAGGDVRLAAGRDNIKRVLDFSGFTKIMAYFDSVEEAVGSFEE
jgi:anti-sigma B factor antagonist